MDKIYLQDILPLERLNLEGKVLLVRHYHDKLYEMNQKGLIEEYQSFQSKPAFIDCKYIVTFLGGEKNSGIFWGVYLNEGIRKLDELPEYSGGLKLYCNPQDKTKDFYLMLKCLPEFERFKNRLVIDWVVPRGWYNTFGEVKSKPVLKLLPDNFVKNFPGLMSVKLNFPELKTIIENPESNDEWYNSLTRLQAIYLILNKKTGLQYIGTTYGENGLWQRWESYVKGDKTGGNKEFIKLKEENELFYKDFQFSILEVLSKTADQKYCSEKETLWKEKLGTRAHGLNKN
jgi:hypothetical protein